MKRLALFDVDNTLISETKGHKSAFTEAFRKVYGVETSIDIINYSGMTDQQIIIDVMQKKGVKKQIIQKNIKKCMKTMVEIFNENLKSEKIEVLDGVLELLEALHKHNVLIGLVTGNIEQIAREKLKKVRINRYFKIGGFGSDNISRTKLVKIAIRHAEQEIKNRVKKKDVFLFGDTPKDIKAAKEAGVNAIGVATGIFNKNELLKADPDLVFKNLSSYHMIIKTILEKN